MPFDILYDQIHRHLIRIIALEISNYEHLKGESI